MSRRSNSILVAAILASVGASISIYWRAAREIASLREAIAGVKVPAVSFIQAEIPQQPQQLSTMTSDDFNQIVQARQEIAALRAARQKKISEDLAANHDNKKALPGTVARANYANLGQATPASALQTWFWALTRHDSATLLACVVPQTAEMLALVFNEMPDGRFPHSYATRLAGAEGFRIMDERRLNPDAMAIKIYLEGNDSTTLLKFTRMDGVWKNDSDPTAEEFRHGTPVPADEH